MKSNPKPNSITMQEVYRLSIIGIMDNFTKELEVVRGKIEDKVNETGEIDFTLEAEAAAIQDKIMPYVEAYEKDFGDISELW